MKDCLLLLTKNFPFGKGEEFIEDEIEMLAKSFEKVVVIATSTENNPVQTRAVPKNVNVDNICASKVKRKMVKAIARQFPFKGYKGYAGKDEHKCVKGSLKKKLYLSYFIAKSEIVYDEIVKILPKYLLENYDGITFYSYWFYDIALAAVRLKKYWSSNAKLAITRAHGYDLYAYRNSLNYLPLRYYILKNIDKVYPCSQNGTDYLMDLYPEYRSKIQTKHLGTRDFGVGKYNKSAVYNIVSCCHLTTIKRIDLLAEALSKLNNSGLPLKWTHFGGGDNLDELKNYAKSNLSFMECNFPGEIKNSDLMKYYKHNQVDLFINTSSSEGLPVSIMEACSFGIPCIATDVGGTSEIVINGKTGFLIDADFSTDKLAKLIKSTLLLPREKMQEIRNNCRSIYLDYYCANKNFAKFAEEIKPTK